MCRKQRATMEKKLCDLLLSKAAREQLVLLANILSAMKNDGSYPKESSYYNKTKFFYRRIRLRS